MSLSNLVVNLPYSGWQTKGKWMPQAEEHSKENA